MSASPSWPDPRIAPGFTAPDTGTVPLFVDRLIPARTQMPLVRLSYLTIEKDDPAPDWVLMINQLQMPILLLGLGAIVLRPLQGARFAQPSDFDAMIQLLEREMGMSVESGDLFLPADMFRERAVAAGQVYRVTQPLFSIGLRYRNALVLKSEFEAVAHDHFSGLEFSEVETFVFQQWHESVMERPPVGKNGELRLRDR